MFPVSVYIGSIVDTAPLPIPAELAPLAGLLRNPGTQRSDVEKTLKS
jgi:hypothetical protein